MSKDCCQVEAERQKRKSHSDWNLGGPLVYLQADGVDDSLKLPILLLGTTEVENKFGIDPMNQGGVWFCRDAQPVARFP